MESADRLLHQPWQYAAYLAVSLFALICTVGLLPWSDNGFHRVLGAANPVLVVVAAAGIGALALWFLQVNTEFAILKGWRTLRGMTWSVFLATVLAGTIIAADLVFRYPQDINVPVPEALLFYPAIGFVAEIAFHVLPLAILLLALRPLEEWLGREPVTWIGIVLVAVLEPAYQVLAEVPPLTGRAVYTGVQVFAIALLQLYVFKRFDFVSMYAFRLFYYAYWHILWGMVRLDVLF